MFKVWLVKYFKWEEKKEKKKTKKKKIRKKRYTFTGNEFVFFFFFLSFFSFGWRHKKLTTNNLGWSQNTTCRRVLVIHKDGRQTVEEIKNDLGIGKTDIPKMIENLKAQGFDPVRVELFN